MEPKIVIGNIFDSDAQTLVNTVNCVGVMGKGIALEFKKRFPEMYEDYRQRCEAGKVELGKPCLYKSLVLPWILNFPTKDHWRSVSKLDDIIRGLEYLSDKHVEWGIESLAVPPLGCGQGQLDWKVVGPTLYRHLKNLTVPVEIYAPYNTPHAELTPSFLDRLPEHSLPAQPNSIKPGWAALVEIVNRIETEPYHWPIGRTSFQKLAYFATEAGLPTDLHFEKGTYGPYSGSLKMLMAKLINHDLIVEKRLGRMFSIQVGKTFDDARRAFLREIEALSQAVDKVVDLFVRLDTRQAELAATVHFSARHILGKNERQPTEIDVLNAAMNWKQNRKPPFDEQETALAIRNLCMLGWLHLHPSPELPINDEILLGV